MFQQLTFGSDDIFNAFLSGWPNYLSSPDIKKIIASRIDNSTNGLAQMLWILQSHWLCRRCFYVSNVFRFFGFPVFREPEALAV